MREIKFRAWDKIQDKICYGLLNERWSPRTMIWLDGRIFSYDERGEKYDKDVSDEFILMQYTGLKDKNDKEIYEGDIVKVYADEEYTGDAIIVSVEFLNGAFVDSYFHWAFNNIKEYKREVIGNIYEHPELLKD